MKKLFTIGIFLAMILGIGSNVSANLIKSAGTGLAGADWAATTAWAGGVVPTGTDSVEIVAGDSVAINVNQGCLAITVSGKLYVSAANLYVNNIIVKQNAVLSLNKTVYCKNVYNYGKIWAPTRTNSGTSTFLYVGYNCSGTTPTASTDSCTILNDGIIGWYRVPAAGGSAKGCGFIVYYPNIAKAANITHSPSVTGSVFTTVAVLPTNAGTQAQDFNLYINESVAVVSTSSTYPFALQNNDAFAATYKRTCTIAAGDTVYVAGIFHKNSAPTVTQGQMTYNIYGCLDMGSYRQSKNEFDLYTSASSPYVAVNVKSGGSLIFGRTVYLVKSAADQTISVIAENGSTVKFLSAGAAPVILSGIGSATTLTTVDNSYFPSSLYNFGIATGSYNVTLPVNTNINVSNLLTMTSGKVLLGTSNLKANSVTGASSTSYIVTDGTGKLTQNALTTGTLFPIGTATAYAPVMVTPAANDTVSATVTATTTGTFAGYAVNANEWTLTPQVATTAALAFTPATATNTTAPAIFSGAGYAAKTDATLTGSTYSASGVNLDAAATIFATGGTTPATAIASNSTSNLLIYAANNTLIVRNAKVGDVVSVYGISGLKVASSVVKGENTTTTLTPGVYIVKTGSTVQKVSVL